MQCRRCSLNIESERLQIITTDLCGGCARKVQPKRVKGAMVWLHKTAPSICVMSAEHYESDWTKYCPKYGMGSGVHAMSPRPAGTR